MQEGKYETPRMVPILDEEGNNMYVKYDLDTSNNEDGIPIRSIISKEEYDDLTEDEKAKYNIYYDYDCVPMESLTYGMIDFVKACKNAAGTLSAEPLDKFFEDPQNKAVVKMALTDMALMAFLCQLIAWLVKSITGSDEKATIANMRKEVKGDPFAYTAYNVVTGALQDAEPTQIIGQWFGAAKGEIPFVTSAERFATSSFKVITGQSTIPYYITQNVGLAKPLQGWAKQYTDDRLANK